MLILGFESSAKAASVALISDGEVISQYFQKSGLTHSKTLLPMAEDLLKNAGLSLSDVDAFACAKGPGSFTGIRIGVSTVKGLCWGTGKNAVGVSTLEAMALSVPPVKDRIICGAMDARRNQVYNALFELSGDGSLVRLCEDRAISLEDLAAELKELARPVYVIGDGAGLCCSFLEKEGIDAIMPPEEFRLQTAVGVCRAAEKHKAESAADLLPAYHRLSQAERERQEKLNSK